jgi:2-methylisocitrate lyase-like PEP mutase family enzyme
MHVPGAPMLLANAWDPASARLVREAGLSAVATSSAAVAAVSGYEDGSRMPAAVALAAVARIAAAVDLPVTADLEDGYGLGPDQLVSGLIEAGACGLNLEDSDHRRGGLVDAGAQAERIAAIKAAARAAGVDLVLNARVDVHLRGLPLAEGLERALRYREAGADCLYPIMLGDPEALREYAAIGPVNALYRPGSPPLRALAEAGVSRISLGSGLFRLAMARARAAARALARGDDADVWDR